MLNNLIIKAMEKNLIEQFPDIFNPENELIQTWKHYENEMRKLEKDYLISKNKVKEYFEGKVLENVTDPALKKILLQPVVRSAGSESEDNLIGTLIKSCMNSNGATGYADGLKFTQTHLMNTFDGIEEFIGKRFLVKEFNAEIWFRKRPYDKENVIINVDLSSAIAVE
jgi:hypothetical protein